MNVCRGVFHYLLLSKEKTTLIQSYVYDVSGVDMHPSPSWRILPLERLTPLHCTVVQALRTFANNLESNLIKSH